MKKIMCKIPHNPPRTYGDCIRACVASIIEADDVPHGFHTPADAEKAWDILRNYLKKKRMGLCVFPLEENPFEFMAENNPDILYLLMAKTRFGDHCVVCRNDIIVHDPSPDPLEITGKHSSGFWVVGVVTVE